MTQTHILANLLIGACTLVLASSCWDEGGAVGTCVPGKVESCPCEDDEPDGTQTCDDDGTWDECDCGSADTDVDTDSDTDSDTEYGPCDELADAVQETIDEACETWPDCSLCEPIDTDNGGEMPTDEECQEALDSYDHDAMLELYLMACEAEQG